MKGQQKMKNWISVFAITLLSVGGLVALNSLRAADGEKPATDLQKDDAAEILDLVERIERLEKRLAKLEGHEPLIRQADSRETSQFNAIDSRPAELTPSEDDDDKDATQRTNGQTWQFRLLTTPQNSRQFVPPWHSNAGSIRARKANSTPRIHFRSPTEKNSI